MVTSTVSSSKPENAHVHDLFDWQLYLFHDRDVHSMLHDSLVVHGFPSAVGVSHHFEPKWLQDSVFRRTSSGTIFLCVLRSDCTSSVCSPSRLKMSPVIDSSSSFHVPSLKIGSVRPLTVTSRDAFASFHPHDICMLVFGMLPICTFPLLCIARAATCIPNFASPATDQVASQACFFAQRSRRRYRNRA